MPSIAAGSRAGCFLVAGNASSGRGIPKPPAFRWAPALSPGGRTAIGRRAPSRTLSPMATTTESVTEICRRARAAAVVLPGTASADKDAALTALAPEAGRTPPPLGPATRGRVLDTAWPVDRSPPVASDPGDPETVETS